MIAKDKVAWWIFK